MMSCLRPVLCSWKNFIAHFPFGITTLFIKKKQDKYIILCATHVYHMYVYNARTWHVCVQHTYYTHVYNTHISHVWHRTRCHMYDAEQESKSDTLFSVTLIAVGCDFSLWLCPRTRWVDTPRQRAWPCWGRRSQAWLSVASEPPSSLSQARWAVEAFCRPLHDVQRCLPNMLRACIVFSGSTILDVHMTWCHSALCVMFFS